LTARHVRRFSCASSKQHFDAALRPHRRIHRPDAPCHPGDNASSEGDTLTDAELETLLTQETDRAERKRKPSDPDRIRQVICAFANDMPGHQQPGVIFVGVDDDGGCAGLSIDEAMLLNLSMMRDDGAITPFPSMRVQRRTLKGCQVAVVIVQPSMSLPVRYGGRVWIRVGPRRAHATPDEERQLLERQRAFDLPFDAREASSTTISDLDISYVREQYLPGAIDPGVLAENRRSSEHQLRSIHFVGPRDAATNVGLLVAGSNTLAHVPGAYVQFLRFDGTELTDPIRDEKMVSGRLADVIRRVDEILGANTATSVSFTTSSTEERQPEYPLAALQQLVRNAVMHRNYEGTNAPVRVYWFTDRIEIHSPGGPYGQVSQANFGHPYASDYRNPHVAEAMRNLGFVQRFGVGIATARNELAKNGNPPPEFDVQSSAVLVTVRRRT
jgi:ATP-dependent DNA helicase RecG